MSTPKNAAEYYKEVIRRLIGGLLPARAENSQCAYRVTNDAEKRCMVGICIPDEKYTKNMEGYSISNTIVFNNTLIPEGMTNLDLVKLQWVHDTYASNVRFQKYLVNAMNVMSCFDNVQKVYPSCVNLNFKGF